MDAGLKLLCLAGAVALGGCARIGYYAQLAQGQASLLAAREPIAEVVQDDRREARLRDRLAQVQRARRFASERLQLPDNDSYTEFADLGRRYALWNVLATPEFSLEPVTDCFPIAGCVAYRGHFDELSARAQAEQFRARGLDVMVGGVPAYSTLGWFDDPVLNTMLHWSEASLVGTVFHELAHQRLYVRDDSAFNESYASFVEAQGLREFLPDAAQVSRSITRTFTERVLVARRELDALYAGDFTAGEMRARKAQVFLDLRHDYRDMVRERWNGHSPWGGWIAGELNNASLLPFGLYDEWVPAFAALFEQVGGDWGRFHAACAALADLARDPRRERLRALMAGDALP